MFVMCQSFVVAKLLAITSKGKVKTIYAVMASRRILMLREGSVDLVGAGGRGVEEFVKNKICRAPKGHKKTFAHATM